MEQDGVLKIYADVSDSVRDLNPNPRNGLVLKFDSTNSRYGL